MVGEHIVGQPEVDIVLRTENFAYVRKKFGLVFLEPHQLKERVAGGRKTISGSHIPISFVNYLKELVCLRGRSAVRPDGDLIKQNLFSLINGNSYKTVPGKRYASDFSVIYTGL